MGKHTQTSKNAVGSPLQYRQTTERHNLADSLPSLLPGVSGKAIQRFQVPSVPRPQLQFSRIDCSHGSLSSMSRTYELRFVGSRSCEQTKSRQRESVVTVSYHLSVCTQYDGPSVADLPQFDGPSVADPRNCEVDVSFAIERF